VEEFVNVPGKHDKMDVKTLKFWRKSMRYIDSNVFIYLVIADEKTERKVLLSKNILLKIARVSSRLPLPR